jgi:hypothetical protein
MQVPLFVGSQAVRQIELRHPRGTPLSLHQEEVSCSCEKVLNARHRPQSGAVASSNVVESRMSEWLATWLAAGSYLQACVGAWLHQE